MEKIAPITSRDSIDSIEPHSSMEAELIEREIRDFVHNYNFDTFSFIFELLDYAKDYRGCLEDLYRDFSVDSVALAKKYKGSNCAGLSLLFQNNTNDYAESVLIPSFGHYMPTQEASDYVEVRTVGLILKNKEDGYSALFPGLTIDKLVPIDNGYDFESMGTVYRVSGVTESTFELHAAKANGELIQRKFYITELTNPDQSMQKNLFKVRTKYQVSHVDNNVRNKLSYYIFGDTFRLRVPSENLSLDMDSTQFLKFISSEDSLVVEAFDSPNLVENLDIFIENRTLVQTLILPSLKKAYGGTMKLHTPGNYRKNHNIIKFAKSSSITDLTVVFIHGLYGTAGERGLKSYILGEKIRRLGVANVAYFNSSRDWKIYKSGDEKKAFCGKTFDEERRDILDMFRVLNERAPEVFGARQKRYQIVANSMGGTMVSTLREVFPRVGKVVLCGSDTGASSATKPILSTYPSKRYVTSAAATFTGDVLLLQGEKDAVVPLASQDELLAAYGSARLAAKKVIPGANHNFSKIDGGNQSLAYELYISVIFSFLMGIE